MSGYTNQDNYWGQPPPQGQYNFDPSGFDQHNQQFEFHTYGEQQSDAYSSYNQKGYLDPTQNVYSGEIYTPDDFTKGMRTVGYYVNEVVRLGFVVLTLIVRVIEGNVGFGDEEEEPPLLEELGIDPDRIMQKTLAVLNPFHRRGQIDDANYLLQDSDLAGPVAFCLVFAAFLLMAGSKAHFGYVYGLAVTSCILMYLLLSLMSSTGNITLSSVASVLGYCLLPVVILAGVSVFSILRSPVGLVSTSVAVAWAALSASRLFSTMSGEENQRLIIAYPCFLLYGVFTLIVIF